MARQVPGPNPPDPPGPQPDPHVPPVPPVVVEIVQPPEPSRTYTGPREDRAYVLTGFWAPVHISARFGSGPVLSAAAAASDVVRPNLITTSQELPLITVSGVVYLTRKDASYAQVPVNLSASGQLTFEPAAYANPGYPVVDEVDLMVSAFGRPVASGPGMSVSVLTHVRIYGNPDFNDPYAPD